MTSYQPQYPPPGQYPPQAQQQPYPQPPGGMPQQGYGAPQPGPMMPSQQASAGYGPPSQGPSPYGQQVAPQGAVSYDVDDAATAEAYANSATGPFGPTPQFLKVPGPRGQLNWDNSVPMNYVGHVYMRILGPWAPGKPIYVESRTHFFKSHKYPKGRVLGYQGEDSLFMRAISEAARSPDPRLQKVAADFGRVRTQYFYNVLDLTHPESHYGQDGKMRPYILSAGKQLNREIGQLAEHWGGISRIVNLQHGRPLKLNKTKDGPEPMNVEYGVIACDPAPLDPYFYPATHAMWDLEEQLQNPSEDDVKEAIRELGLPMPSNGSFQVPAGYLSQAQAQNMAYDPNPSPPYQNPYPASQQQGAPPAMGMPPQFDFSQQQAQGVPPPPAQYAPPPQTHAPMDQPPPPAMGAPPAQYGAPLGPPPAQYGAPPGSPPAQYGAPPGPLSAQYGAPPGPPPAQYGAPPGPPPAQYGQPSPPPQPPPMTPPPVSSGGAAPSGYTPQGGGGPPPF